MIADLDKTIERLLKEEMPIKNGEIDIKFDLPKREWSTRLSKPTVNFYLYDVRDNPTLRQHQWQEVPANGRPADGMSHRKRTPFRVDCFYMLTAWAAEPRDEHRLLTRCLRALFRFPILPEDRLEGSLQNPSYDILARLANHDQLTNPAELWSALDNEMRPSIPYVVTLALDPWEEITGPIVQTLTLRPGPSPKPWKQQLTPDEDHPTMNFIGGTVRNKREGTPMAGIEVAIKGTGLFATTDAEGRFVLGSMPSDDYTLVVWPGEGKPKEKKISVPAVKDGNYDLEL